MIYLCTILLIIASLKMLSVIRATMWIGRHGHEYSKLVPEGGFTSQNDYWNALTTSKAPFFPFGVKDYALMRVIAGLRSRNGFARLLAHVLGLLYRALYRFEYLALLSGLVAIVSVASDGTLATKAVPYALAMVILVTTLILSVEAVFAWAVFDEYAQYFHKFNLADERWAGESLRLLQLKPIAGLVIITFWAGSSAAYIGHVAFEAFQGGNKLPAFPEDIPSSIDLLWQCLYFTVTTVASVGYGDITPRNAFGQAVALVLELQAFAILGIVFASFIGGTKGDA